MHHEWPYLTHDIAAVPFTIKERYEDFIVEEIPAYEPCGEGEHVYCCIEKTGLSTQRAVRDMGRALGVNPRDIGYAGQKDARGVTRQVMSFQGVPPERLEQLAVPRIKILWTNRHRNKLRIGHLKGNRFAIKLRDFDLARLTDAEQSLERLMVRGVPNYFGDQRFGSRGDTADIGRALLLGQHDEAAALIAGRAGEHDTGRVLEARRLFDEGRFAESATAWPRGYDECVAVCRAMSRGTDAKKAVLGVDRRALSLYVSACQSRIFNNVLAARIQELDLVYDGDIASKQENGALFECESGEAEAPRAARFEISATGPLFGPRMKEPKGRIAVLEAEMLAAEGLTRESFEARPPLESAGGRRPLRFRPQEAAIRAGDDETGPFVEVAFVLPAGCYATAVLREIGKRALNDVVR